MQKDKLCFAITIPITTATIQCSNNNDDNVMMMMMMMIMIIIIIVILLLLSISLFFHCN